MFDLARPLQADPASKEAVLQKYEQAVSLTEELNVYEQDAFHVLPKLRLASKALLKDDLAQADRLLDDVLANLALMRSKKPVELGRDLKLEWLEIYLEVFQKYALLALLAFLGMGVPFLRRGIAERRLGLPSQFLVGLSAVLLGAFLSLFDLARYGESAWAFFDIQVVLLVIAGLLGGLGTGFASALALAGFRWFLQPHFLIYPGVVLAAGIIGGTVRLRIASFRKAGIQSFSSGALAGLVHGLLIYLPAARWMTPFYLGFSIAFLALLEGAGVFLFFSVVKGILKDEDQRQTERELWKTRLLFLRAQMNPHFVFNALNTIALLCGKESADQAKGLVLKLSEFLRARVRGEDEKISLREEMANVEAYLELEKVRFQERLRVDKDIELDSAAWEAKVPGWVIQPLVENAVRHGIGKKEAGGTVRVRMRHRHGMLEIEISDDGVGMNPAQLDEILDPSARPANRRDLLRVWGTHRKEASEEGAGIGLKNIRERLRRYYGTRHGLQFEIPEGGGTRVTMRIPIEREGGNL